MSDYFEKIEIGETDAFGTYEVTEEDVVSFGEQFDPQPFHVDEDAARESMFGGLVASGWHTASMTMRLLVDNFLADSRALGAVGIDDLRFPSPVRPGDALRVETEVVDKEVWDEDRGLVHCAIETSNADGVVLTMVGLVLWERE
ncbi:MaoC family dehydratase [Halobacteria archaeon HArc-gm2]|nr:MaoC family dehydratase [Halobacteria archaeon HArc-gm2]